MKAHESTLQKLTTLVFIQNSKFKIQNSNYLIPTPCEVAGARAQRSEKRKRLGLVPSFCFSPPPAGARPLSFSASRFPPDPEPFLQPPRHHDPPHILFPLLQPRASATTAGRNPASPARSFPPGSFASITLLTFSIASRILPRFPKPKTCRSISTPGTKAVMRHASSAWIESYSLPMTADPLHLSADH
jgi:hypothetical protein